MKGNKPHTCHSHNIHYEHTSTSESARPIFAAVLLHGIMADSDSLNHIAEDLVAQFGEDVLVIQPKNREGYVSAIKSIKKQAKIVSQEIEAAIAPYNQAGPRLPVFLIGYSQGGVVGCKLAKDYGDVLDIRSLITVHAPLRGVPLLETQQSNLSQFLYKGEPGLSLIYNSPENAHFYQGKRKRIRRLKLELRIRTELLCMVRSIYSNRMAAGLFLRGLTDLFPNSSVLLEINNVLRKENTKIPCLLIGGYQDNFEEIFHIQISNTDSKKAKDLNKAIAYFITGKESAKHDMLIPLASQLSRGESLLNLQIDMAVGHKSYRNSSDKKIQLYDMRGYNLRGYVYTNTSHCDTYFSIDSDLCKVNEKIDISFFSKSIHSDMYAFIREKLKMHTPPKSLRVGAQRI